MDKVRIGIVGIGNMGSDHAMKLLRGDVERCELTAVCDHDPERLARVTEVKQFSSSEEMIRSGEIDAILIATPHYSHTTIGIDALENGIHVLTEKPISVHKADCERLIAAAKAAPDVVFGAMFQLRTMPLYQKVRDMIAKGELGKLHRAVWVVTNWFRSEAYYASGGWRATWEGEGGGVLLNQCPHNLDLFQWILGEMPNKMRAFCHFGKYHNIEVEDDVTAYMEFPSGATGVFVTTTGEAPGTNRFEIHGERGKIILEAGQPLKFIRNEVEITEYSRTTEQKFATPGRWDVTIDTAGGGGGHMLMVKDFVEAILDGKKLLAPGEDGIHSIELANSMLYSAWTDSTVDLPLDAAAYEAALKEKIAGSTFQKETVVKSADANDFASSY